MGGRIMATTINADTSNGIVITPDTSGELELQSNGTTLLKVDSPTGSLTIPTGTTAQRPVSPTVGMTRFNTTTGNPEWYDSNSSQWVEYNQTAPYAVEYLVIAGGAGGGRGRGGGGGSGGFLTGTSYINPSNIYTVTVGAGGAGSTSPSVRGSNGNTSVFSSISTVGGGGGASESQASPYTGAAGGSGGGSTLWETTTRAAGTAGQGNDGGVNTPGYLVIDAGGGGGGAGAVGGDSTSTQAGSGGAGLASSITGTAITYAGGGGGGVGGQAAGVGG